MNILSHFRGVVKVGDNTWKALCPAHDDKKPSLSITYDGDKWLLHCFAGCSVKEILDEVGLDEKDLFEDRGGKPYHRRSSKTSTRGGEPGHVSDVAPHALEEARNTKPQVNDETTYDYTDKEGNNLYRKVRKSGKNFFWWRYDKTRDCWVPGIRGIQRVLYNLPGLAKRIPDGDVVFYVEGEKDADRLINEGLLATTAGGAGDWRDDMVTQLTGAKEVVVLVDADKAGRDSGSRVAKAIRENLPSTTVKLFDFYPERDDGVDVSDWLDEGHTKAELLQLVEGLPVWDGTPLRNPDGLVEVEGDDDEDVEVSPTSQSYPVDVIPSPLRDVILAIHYDVQAPLELIAQSVLATATLATQAGYAVDDNGYVTYLNQFYLTVAEPSEGKTVIDNYVLASLRAFQKDLCEMHNRLLKDYESAKRKAEKAGLTEPTPPRLPYILYNDVTREGLINCLGNGLDFAGLFSDEGGEFFGGYSLQKERVTQTISTLNKLYSGSLINSTTKKSGVIALEDKRLTAHFMIQSVVLRRTIFSTPAFEGQGFLNRFLIAAPESTLGYRVDRVRKYHNSKEKETFDALLRRLLGGLDKNALLRGEPIRVKTLPISTDVRRIIGVFYENVQLAMRAGGRYYRIRSYAERCREHTLKLAGLFAAVNNHERLELDDVTSAIELVGWYLEERLRLTEYYGINSLEDAVEEVIEQIKEKAVNGVLSVKQITEEVQKQGYGCKEETIGRVLNKLGYKEKVRRREGAYRRFKKLA